MSLAELIRGKSAPEEFATATVATATTETGRSVAEVATVAVAEPKLGIVELLASQAPLRVAPATAPGDGVTDYEIALEAEYGRVTCLRCANLSWSGVCRALSTARTNYTPLQYEPVMLWRRCDDYRP